MKNIFIILLLIICQSFVFAQDKKVNKIAKYIEKGKGVEAKELLDELDSKSEYQNDIYFWYVRAVYYRNIALHSNDQNSAKTALQEGRKSFSKLEELDKRKPNSDLSQYFPTLKKDLFEGKNQITETKKQTDVVSFYQPNNDEKTVTLTEVGKGNSKDAAKLCALRNAIEKAFGTFISSNTSVINDNLIKDEIVSISNGNIQSFEILSEEQMADGSNVCILKATVSVKKLISFCENKGIKVSYKGNLFAANIKLIQIYTKNECILHNNLMQIFRKNILKGFDYTITASDPVRQTDHRAGLPPVFWRVPLSIKVNLNSNILSFFKLYESAIINIALNNSEIDYYKSHNLELYEIDFNNKKYTLRTGLAAANLEEILKYFLPKYALNFKIKNGISVEKGSEIISKNYQESGFWLAHHYTFNLYSIPTSFSFSVNQDLSLSELEKISEYSIVPFSYLDPKDDTSSACEEGTNWN